MNRFARRRFLQGAALSAAQAGATPAADPSRPNILWIMADQFRFDCMGANGNSLIRTPHLDKLAAGGANFTNCFVQAPVCVPSRISYFTGRYPHSHKNRVNYTPCDPREVMIQQILGRAGYRTGSVGKLHFYPPTAAQARSLGFEEVRIDDGVPSTDPYSDYVRWRKANDPGFNGNYWALSKDIGAGKNPFRSAAPYELSPTYWTGMQTRSLLRDFCASPGPFFLFSSFFKPHSPHVLPPPFDTLYDGAEIPLPPRVTPDDIAKLPLPVQKQIQQSPMYAVDRERLEWMYRSYYGSVTMIDREVGTILDELEKSGKAENTIVIFSTDHGDQIGEHGLDGKNVFFEASVHVPLIVRFPRRLAAERYRQLIESVDVLPTLLDLCGLQVPVHVQGRSFAPLVGGNPEQYVPKEIVFAENIIPSVTSREPAGKWAYVPARGIGGVRHPDAKMARTERWKLNYYPTCDGELYDLYNDPGETRNLWSDGSSAGMLHSLQNALLRWMTTADETEQILLRTGWYDDRRLFHAFQTRLS